MSKYKSRMGPMGYVSMLNYLELKGLIKILIPSTKGPSLFDFGFLKVFSFVFYESVLICILSTKGRISQNFLVLQRQNMTCISKEETVTGATVFIMVLLLVAKSPRSK